MLEEVARDATEAFEDVGHSDEARAMLPKMYIGEFKGDVSGLILPCLQYARLWGIGE
jgi:cytochrome b involved in lipid metabolism